MEEIWIAIADEGGSGWSDLVKGNNVPGLILISLAGIPGIFAIIKMMLKLQKEFADVYVEENRTLRERLKVLEDDEENKDAQIVELKLQVGRLENTVANHEATIQQLREIIDRRKLT